MKSYTICLQQSCMKSVAYQALFGSRRPLARTPESSPDASRPYNTLPLPAAAPMELDPGVRQDPHRSRAWLLKCFPAAVAQTGTLGWPLGLGDVRMPFHKDPTY